MQDKLQLEDTVSADRKERIIFDPDAWRKSDKSGRKTSAITSRQNFDNEKFTRKAEKQVEEGLQQTLRKFVPGYAKKQIDKKMDAGKFGKTDADKDANFWRYKKVQDKLKKEEVELDESNIQPSGDSKVDSASPTQSDTISTDKNKKSNSPQIEFVTGNQVQVSSSTASGSAQATGRKIAESLVKKALTQVKADKNVGTEETPFDGSYNKTSDPVVDSSCSCHSPMSRVRDLARQAMSKQVKEEVIDEKAPEGFEGTVKAMKKHKEIDNPWALANWMKKKGYKSRIKEDSNEEGDTNMSEKKTYAQFMEQLLEYTPGPGGVTRVQGRSYGAQYHDPDGDDDADSKPAVKADAPKRGRGRPKGAKSGANQKVTTGKSYGGIATHSLNLPNSNR